jgi:hypothetical protein
MRILVTSHLSIWTVIIMAHVCGNEARLRSWAENVMCIWDHLVLVNKTFDGYVIDLSIIVSMLPFIVEVGVGASGDGEDCTMGEKVVRLLWKLADL